MPLWESNEIYFLACVSVLVTLGVFASLAYFVYKRVVTTGRRANDEQAALEKVLLRKEAITSSPPTKPLIVSPSFSSPNKVPARHLRSGSYSPSHYLSPYHNRQPRRNSSPTSNLSIQQPKLPQLQLYHPQNEEGTPTPSSCCSGDDDSGVASNASTSPVPGTGNENVDNAYCVPLIKTNSNEQEQQNGSSRINGPGSLAHHNSQYYGTISPRRGVGRHHRSGVVAPAENNLGVVAATTAATTGTAAFLPIKSGTGAVIGPNLKYNSFIKSEYVQLPGKDGADFIGEEWKNKDDSSAPVNKWKKNCSDVDDAALRRKLLLQKQYQQKLQLQQQHNRMASDPPGELFKMKHTVDEEIPYYISTQ